MIDTLLVLGATGDLSGRLLLPALASLRSAGLLGPGFRLVGAGPQPWTTEQFGAFVRDRLAQHAPDTSAADRDGLIAASGYQAVDVSDPVSVATAIDIVTAASGSAPIAVYLALPTQLMLGAVEALAAARLPPGSRLAVEKPFGHDYDSAVELNAALQPLDGHGRESSVYRVDHALAMTAVQRLPQAHRPGTDERIEWSGTHIEQIDLLWEEALALEGRAAFYDHAGALRDVVQNHLLQVLLTVAQPSPDGDDVGTGETPGRREAVLRSIRRLDRDAVRTSTRRARYTAGRLAEQDGGQGRTVPDYAAEDGVDPARETETFAEVTLLIDSPQWEGTRFVLRAGKALDGRRRGVRVHFRPGAAGRSERQDSAWFDVDDPTTVGLGGAAEPDVQPADAPPVDAEPAAYLHILNELLHDGSAFAVIAGEAELGWQIFQPVLEAWADDVVPLLTYPAGSPGPT